MFPLFFFHFFLSMKPLTWNEIVMWKNGFDKASYLMKFHKEGENMYWLLIARIYIYTSRFCNKVKHIDIQEIDGREKANIFFHQNHDKIYFWQKQLKLKIRLDLNRVTFFFNFFLTMKDVSSISLSPENCSWINIAIWFQKKNIYIYIYTRCIYRKLKFF